MDFVGEVHLVVVSNMSATDTDFSFSQLQKKYLVLNKPFPTFFVEF